MKPDEMKELAQLIQKVPGLKGIDFKEVKRLADLLRETPEIGSIELKGIFGTGVVITRTGTQVAGAQAASPPALAQFPNLPTPAPGGTEPARPGAGSALKEIKSPMVGTFYSAPEPGADPYVKVGARITSGQTVCIIEAMKIMNEIEAEFGGVIREINVEDAQPVEFGQILFRVDPNG
ncbi:MAG TPA: acetyl-CoA carboxylase biotin carboxyl carrier protein [Gemmatimonadales bacterium]|jgi:acetyl-CoA carboxylase biotin carboxyl carrier protein|nr:acetyl-CoA carboxylase biotin carboxyl carrier protein [Gemmatimonadales bacterium]